MPWHSEAMADALPRVLAVPHGGGPMPILGDPAHDPLITFLRTVASTIGRPKAIVVVSAHWETTQPSITAAQAPGLIYDYGGFPPEAYELAYPAPGAPELAAEIGELLQAGGFDPMLRTDRGFDHGVFVPLLLMYPDAQIPVVQLSMLAGLDPIAHLQMGQSIASITDRDVLVLGSGFTFHNMGAFSFGPSEPTPDPENESFEAWLRDTVSDRSVTPEQRRGRLEEWATAPGARWSHPREEHLLPLHVCAGAAGLAHADVVFDDVVLGKRTSGYAWPAR